MHVYRHTQALMAALTAAAVCICLHNIATALAVEDEDTALRALEAIN